MNDNNFCVIYGKFLGFPDCCVLSFMSENHLKTKRRKLAGTGYIPCKDCNNKSEKELIAAINKNRICKSPFPNDDLSFLDSCHEIMISSHFSLEQKISYSKKMEQAVKKNKGLPKKICLYLGNNFYCFKVTIDFDYTGAKPIFTMPIRRLKRVN